MKKLLNLNFLWIPKKKHSKNNFDWVQVDQKMQNIKKFFVF